MGNQSTATGASAVLPSSLPSTILRQAIQNILSMINHSLVDAAVPTTISQHSYQREEVIRLEQDTVLEVLHGVVALTAIHSDGAQVLLGLYGPRQILVGYPEDAYCIQFLAYADTTILVHPWHEFAKEPACPELLLSRLRQMEAWASVQARPYLDQRLLGILSLLAEQFGVPHA
jgi:CRP-like cAMP-binding protein